MRPFLIQSGTGVNFSENLSSIFFCGTDKAQFHNGDRERAREYGRKKVGHRHDLETETSECDAEMMMGRQSGRGCSDQVRGRVRVDLAPGIYFYLCWILLSGYDGMYLEP